MTLRSQANRTSPTRAGQVTDTSPPRRRTEGSNYKTPSKVYVDRRWAPEVSYQKAVEALRKADGVVIRPYGMVFSRRALDARGFREEVSGQEPNMYALDWMRRMSDLFDRPSYDGYISGVAKAFQGKTVSRSRQITRVSNTR